MPVIRPCEHWQGEGLRTPEPEEHVADEEKRQRPYLPEGVSAQPRIADYPEGFADGQDDYRGGDLSEGQHLKAGELVRRQHRLVYEHDEEGGQAVEQARRDPHEHV